METENNLWVDVTLAGILDMYEGMPTPLESSTWGKIKTLFAE